MKSPNFSPPPHTKTQKSDTFFLIKKFQTSTYALSPITNFPTLESILKKFTRVDITTKEAPFITKQSKYIHGKF